MLLKPSIRANARLPACTHGKRVWIGRCCAEAHKSGVARALLCACTATSSVISTPPKCHLVLHPCALTSILFKKLVNMSAPLPHSIEPILTQINEYCMKNKMSPRACAVTSRVWNPHTPNSQLWWLCIPVCGCMRRGDRRGAWWASSICTLSPWVQADHITPITAFAHSLRQPTEIAGC